MRGPSPSTGSRGCGDRFRRRLTQQVLDDFESAHIDPKLKRDGPLLRKMTLEPEALTSDDASDGSR